MGFSLQSVYDHSPVIFQHVMTSGSGYLRNRSRYRKTYWAHRSWLNHFDQWSYDRKVEFQQRQLLEFVKCARAESEFYKETITGAQVEELELQGDLSVLPFLEKEVLRSNIQRVNTSIGPSVEAHTGGTTGKSLVVRMTNEDMMLRMAMLDHFKSRVGFEHLKMRRATFMGKHIVPPNSKTDVFWRYNHACKQMLYSSFHLSRKNLKYYVDSLNKFKPAAIDGFFTSMLDVATFIEQEGLPVDFTPVGIFPTSETITDSGRELLERVFRAKVYNQYASSEGAPFITECDYGTLHIEHSTGVFENFTPGSSEIAVTSFTTHGTPLIRYKIGDSIKLKGRTDCDCGIESDAVESIEGRNDDYLVRADGSRISNANLSNLFKNMPNSVVAAQLIQKEVGEVTILLEVDEKVHQRSSNVLLHDEFRHVFGASTSLVVKQVDSIPREASGKRRFVKNLITP